MNTWDTAKVSLGLLSAILFRRRFPLCVGWNITHRCILQCHYCYVRKYKTPELDTQRIVGMISEFSGMGTKFITFGGGEPLLREDLGEIIEACRQKHIRVGINSNGTLVKTRFHLIKNIQEIKFSFDGTEEVHDAMRGRGSHAKVLEAMETCSRAGIPMSLTMVITKHNTQDIPYVLDMADRYGAGAYFQPADQHLSGKSGNALPMAPLPQTYRKAIAYLMQEKRRGRKAIRVSRTSLNHLYHWPKPKTIKCMPELVFCYIEPDGRMFLRDMFPHFQKYLVTTEQGIRKTFEQLSLPYPCRECWCSSMVETNMVGSLKPEALGGSCVV